MLQNRWCKMMRWRAFICTLEEVRRCTRRVGTWSTLKYDSSTVIGESFPRLHASGINHHCQKTFVRKQNANLCLSLSLSLSMCAHECLCCSRAANCPYYISMVGVLLLLPEGRSIGVAWPAWSTMHSQPVLVLQAKYAFIQTPPVDQTDKDS